MSLRDLRRHYQRHYLTEADVAPDPFTQFNIWLQEAIDTSPGDWFEATAMTLSTADAEGRVSSRVLLLKEFDPHGFVFYTNYTSQKADDLAANPQAAILFFWPHLERQVRIEGTVAKTDRESSASYFASRPRGSQLGAVASKQSQVVAGREVLERALAEADAKFAGGDVPLPDEWGGYRLAPASIEFWQGRPDRLHDRLRYRRDEQRWVIERLSP